jgi:hypothetical protein
VDGTVTEQPAQLLLDAAQNRRIKDAGRAPIHQRVFARKEPQERDGGRDNGEDEEGGREVAGGVLHRVGEPGAQRNAADGARQRGQNEPAVPAHGDERRAQKSVAAGGQFGDAAHQQGEPETELDRHEALAVTRGIDTAARPGERGQRDRREQPAAGQRHDVAGQYHPERAAGREQDGAVDERGTTSAIEQCAGGEQRQDDGGRASHVVDQHRQQPEVADAIRRSVAGRQHQREERHGREQQERRRAAPIGAEAGHGDRAQRQHHPRRNTSHRRPRVARAGTRTAGPK